MDKVGYVYVLSNPSMPGILKIGRSVNGGKQRATALYSTGVPTPFVLEFELLTSDAPYIEKAVHESLARFRLKDSREFFKCEVNEAAESIINEHVDTFDRCVCSADERYILDRFLMAGSKTNHHFMTVLYSLENIEPSDIDGLVQRKSKNLRVVK